MVGLVVSVVGSWLYEVPPHNLEYNCPLKQQPKQFHIIFYTLFPSLPASAKIAELINLFLTLAGCGSKRPGSGRTVVPPKTLETTLEQDRQFWKHHSDACRRGWPAGDGGAASRTGRGCRTSQRLGWNGVVRGQRERSVARVSPGRPPSGQNCPVYRQRSLEQWSDSDLRGSRALQDRNHGTHTWRTNPSWGRLEPSMQRRRCLSRKTDDAVRAGGDARQFPPRRDVIRSRLWLPSGFNPV